MEEIKNPAMEKKEEQQAAIDLMNENVFLKDDTLTRDVVYAGGVYGGEELDLGTFLDARKAYLEGQAIEGRLAAAKAKNPRAYEVAVVSSVAPHLEKNLEE